VGVSALCSDPVHCIQLGKWSELFTYVRQRAIGRLPCLRCFAIVYIHVCCALVCALPLHGASLGRRITSPHHLCNRKKQKKKK
jgi:hypothetical protein